MKDPGPYQGQIMSTENNLTEAHKMYLTQKAQSYKMELEMVLNSSKSNVLPGKKLGITYFYKSNYHLKMDI